MYITVNGTFRSVVPFSYGGLVGDTFRVTYDNGDGPFTSTFIDGTRAFTT